MFYKTTTVLLLLTSSLMCFVAADEVNYSECSMILTVDSVSMDGCNKDGCTMPLGQNISFSFTVNTRSYEFNSLTSRASIVIDGVMEYELKDTTPTNPCESLGCPLHQNNNLKYTGSTYISNEFPVLPVKHQFRFVLKDGNDDEIVCFKYNVNLE